ncbi:phosphohistidine phosphatase SixA [Planctomycetales bacterium ZRK34]|nr:phosphohistidine phosphatase SixA [Planctomycetales bacterium ZRK34]
MFRHGIAEAHGPDGSDASRRLTSAGVKKTREAAAGLSRFAHVPEVILTSPLTRAVQTADILGATLDLRPQVEDVLAYGPAEAVIQMLSERSENTVMLVGHEPTFSQCVERVCTRGAEGFVQMKKAGCACVSYDPGRQGRLMWLASPKMLRALATKK